MNKIIVGQGNNGNSEKEKYMWRTTAIIIRRETKLLQPYVIVVHTSYK